MTLSTTIGRASTIRSLRPPRTLLRDPDILHRRMFAAARDFPYSRLSAIHNVYSN